MSRPRFLDISDPTDEVLICRECTTDEIVQAFIDKKGDHTCSGCGKGNRGAYKVLIIARTAAKTVIPTHFRLYEEANRVDATTLSLEQVLSHVLGIANHRLCELMAADLRKERAFDPFYAADRCYVGRPTDFEQQEDKRAFVIDLWERVSSTILHGQRYYNAAATGFFERLFEEALAARTRTLWGNHPTAARVHSPGLKLYRARRLDGDANMEKRAIVGAAESRLGAPPKKKAAQNRMNPRGIPLFYGARERETCIAEVRPSIGDTVAVGLFETTQEIKFFDFRTFSHFRANAKLSYWHNDYEQRLICRELLRHLSEIIAQPVREGEIGYITTQAMAEYIRYKLDGGFGGIIFNSVQHASGANYVIFSDSDVLELLDDSDHEPCFPVKLYSGPYFYTVDSVVYSTKWDKPESTVSDS